MGVVWTVGMPDVEAELVIPYSARMQRECAASRGERGLMKIEEEMGFAPKYAESNKKRAERMLVGVFDTLRFWVVKRDVLSLDNVT